MAAYVFIPSFFSLSFLWGRTNEKTLEKWVIVEKILMDLCLSKKYKTDISSLKWNSNNIRQFCLLYFSLVLIFISAIVYIVLAIITNDLSITLHYFLYEYIIITPLLAKNNKKNGKLLTKKKKWTFLFIIIIFRTIKSANFLR